MTYQLFLFILILSFVLDRINDWIVALAGRTGSFGRLGTL